MIDDAPVELVAYDPNWPAAFEAELELIRQVAGEWLLGPIEHVGSTAVPGLPAKPVIDIMAAVRDLVVSRPAIAALATIDYCYAPYQADRMHCSANLTRLRAPTICTLFPYTPRCGARSLRSAIICE